MASIKDIAPKVEVLLKKLPIAPAHLRLLKSHARSIAHQGLLKGRYKRLRAETAIIPANPSRAATSIRSLRANTAKIRELLVTLPSVIQRELPETISDGEIAIAAEVLEALTAALTEAAKNERSRAIRESEELAALRKRAFTDERAKKEFASLELRNRRGEKADHYSLGLAKSVAKAYRALTGKPPSVRRHARPKGAKGAVLTEPYGAYYVLLLDIFALFELSKNAEHYATQAAALMKPVKEE